MRAGWVLAVFVAGAFSYLRSGLGYVEGPYWFLTYTSGFIRRGFLGTLVSPFLVGTALPHASFIICVISAVFAAIYLACIAVLAGQIFTVIGTRRAQLAWSGIVVIFLFSPGLPELAYNFGTLDTPIALLALLLAASVFRCTIWITCAISLIGPLIHEAFFFLALPLVGSVWWHWRDRRTHAAMAAIIIGAVTTAVWQFSNANFAWQAGIPLSQADLHAFALYQLGQRAQFIGLPHVPSPVWLWALGPVLASAAVLAMALQAAGGGASLRVIAGSLFSASILLIAIDTKRLADWACLTAPALCALELLKAGKQSFFEEKDQKTFIN